jgi:DNA-binding NarL/FixJ family response regulator
MRRKVIYERIELDDITYDSNDVKILEGIAAGKNRNEIAKECFLSKRTIDTKIDNMAKTLLVDGQTALVLKAVAMGIINNPYIKAERPKAEYNNIKAYN